MDGSPVELGRGAMGVTYKALDIHLRCPVALKIISARFLGDDSARRRFVREARAAASVRHPNVASVFHLGESGGDYFYAMEFVDGETLEQLIAHSGRVEVGAALAIAEQTAAGLAAIQKQHLVHRDIKPSNIMVSVEEGWPESVKIIDLGLAKGAAEGAAISVLGSFTGTPRYASPEQFAGLGADIRSDLYSLGISLWEMLSGKAPFQGSPAELMHQHQHVAPPFEKLKGVPPPVVTLLSILLAKDPGQRFQDPGQLRKALPRVREAVAAGRRLTADELRSPEDLTSSGKAGAERAAPPDDPSQGSARRRAKHPLQWWAALGLAMAGFVLGLFFFLGPRGILLRHRAAGAAPTGKSIAVLPFENIGGNPDDTYFADGVQEEILNDLARIAQLRVTSRTSVMQYRADRQRDLHQIANTLEVDHVLEGTVQRDRDRVRVSTELIDAASDRTLWADSYDRRLTDIFSIQSEIAQTVAKKLESALTGEQKKVIEEKPTQNLQAYDWYLRGKDLLNKAIASENDDSAEKQLLGAVSKLNEAVALDPQFAVAYCALTQAHDALYRFYDSSLARRNQGDAAINEARRRAPESAEVRLAYAGHLYYCYRDYARLQPELELARRSLPNNVDLLTLEAYIARRQGRFADSIRAFEQALRLDPTSLELIQQFSFLQRGLRHFKQAQRLCDRAVELAPNDLGQRDERANLTFFLTGDPTELRAVLSTVTPGTEEYRNFFTERILLALYDRNWAQAEAQINEMGENDSFGGFGYAQASVPPGCYSILIARLRGSGDHLSDFDNTRDRLAQSVADSGDNPRMLSALALVDILLGDAQKGCAEAERAVALISTQEDLVTGPNLETNLALVYAWAGEANRAFDQLFKLAELPFLPDLSYGSLKTDPLWDPLRNDPRYHTLLAKLKPSD